MLELVHRAILRQDVAAKRYLFPSDAQRVARSQSCWNLGLSGCRHNADKNSTVSLMEERGSAEAVMHCLNAIMYFIELGSQ